MPKLYESTPHRLRWRTTTEKDTSSSTIVNSEDDSDEDQVRHRQPQQQQQSTTNILPDGVAFVVHNFLSTTECNDIIEQAENMGLQQCNLRFRKTRRIAAFSEDTATVLFQRLLPYIEEYDTNILDFTTTTTTTSSKDQENNNSNNKNKNILTGIPPCVVNDQKCWQPVGLNPVFRICKYTTNDFFYPHYDDGFIIDPLSYRSLRTFMVYLNDGYTGGTTNFYNETQKHYTTPNPNNIIYTYQPQQGDLIVFNSNITHDGGKLFQGTKYILRSEIMYKTYCKNNAAVSSQSQSQPISPKSTPQTTTASTSGGLDLLEESFTAVANNEPSAPIDYDPDVEFTWP